MPLRTKKSRHNKKEGERGPGATDTEDENDRFLKAAKAADTGQLRTAA